MLSGFELYPRWVPLKDVSLLTLLLLIYELDLKAKWVQEGMYTSFHMESKPVPGSQIV